MSNLRVVARKKEIQAYFEGTLLPGETLPSLRARHPRILSKYALHQFPKWEVSLRCSHTSEALFRWICSKKVLGYRLSYEEKLLLYHLGLEDRRVVLLQSLLQVRDQNLAILLAKGRFEHNPSLVYLNRILLGYRPSVLYSKAWKTRRTPSIRIIGVGYKDKGTLGSGLSWKEQILPEEEETPSALNEFNLSVYSLLGMTHLLTG